MRRIKSQLKRSLANLFVQPWPLRFVQYLFDQKLNLSDAGWFSRFRIATVTKFSSWILKISDPLVTHEIGGTRISMPFSHRLPLYLKLYPQYSANTARIAAYVQQKYSDLTFVDVGANIGDTAALLRSQAKFPILCIEGDQAFFSILIKNTSLFSDVYPVRVFLGQTSGSLAATIVRDGGTAHIEEDAYVDDSVSTQTLSALLEQEPFFLSAKMIKIDTDGFEAKILLGAKDFLARAKPVVFFEYDPFFLSQQRDDGIGMLKNLWTLGYRKLLVYDNLGDLMIATPLDNWMVLEDITHYFTGRQGYRYCDMCAFHADDEDLFEKVRQAEIRFFELSRGVQQS